MKPSYLYEFLIDYPVVKNNRVESIVKAGSQFKGFNHFKLTTGLSDFQFRRLIKLGLVKVVTRCATVKNEITTDNINTDIVSFNEYEK